MRKRNRIQRFPYKIVLVLLLAVTVGIFFLVGCDKDDDSEIAVFGTSQQTGRLSGKEREYANFLSGETFFQGISVQGIDLSGLTPEESVGKLNSKAMELLKNFSLTVIYKDEKWTSAADLGASVNTQDAIDKAFSYGRDPAQGDLTTRYNMVKALVDNPIDQPLKVGYNPDKVSDLIASIDEKYGVELKNSYASGFDIYSETFILEESSDGVTLHTEDALKQALALLDDPTATNRTVTITSDTTQATVHRSELESKLGYITYAWTPISGGLESPRNQNLNRAAQQLNGVLIPPGATISYTEILGPQTEENGYAPAPVQIGGGLSDQFGGGLCQPSTTLFQAASLANLTITERWNHGLLPGYTSGGMDAMIADWGPDLRITNNSDYPYAIMASFLPYDGFIVWIFGKQLEPGESIALEAHQTSSTEPQGDDVWIVDPALKPGEVELVKNRATGSTWETYRVYYQDGVEVHRELLVYSDYDVQVGEWKKGPDGVPGPPAETAAPTESPETHDDEEDNPPETYAGEHVPAEEPAPPEESVLEVPPPEEGGEEGGEESGG